jgi:predicted dehydrogenase
MRFALLGNHPDGLEMASALVESGRHPLAAYTAPVGDEWLRRWGPAVRRVSDLEEVLADPAVEAVIVAGTPPYRPDQLRRALQSERHVLCVHPPDHTPEIAHEAAMIQKDTGRVLLPLLYESLHPGVRRLAAFLRRAGAEGRGPAGTFRLLEVERASTGEVLEDLAFAGPRPALPGWDVLRALGGEVAEVSTFAAREELGAGEPVLLAGRFERGGLFQVTLLPNRPEARLRIAVIGDQGRTELLFPLGWPGPAFLDWRDETGERREEAWERWDPWPALVRQFEAALDRKKPDADGMPALSWQDTVRSLELDDAARRSAARRRTSLLEYPEASEEVGFKGTMTLAGCGLLWGVLFLLILSVWVPMIGWLIVPLLAVFLGLQFLRYLIPNKRDK